MTAQELRNSILQYAMQGKLVPQDPSDEPAITLLEKINAEKRRLVNDKKIKAEKPLLPIKEDEIPYEVPDSWEWVRFGEIANYNIGKTPPRKDSIFWDEPKYNWVSIADLVGDGIVKNTKESVNQYSFDNVFKKKIIPKGTLLMSFKLTVGKVSIVDIDSFHNEAIISIFPFVDMDKTMTKYLFKSLPLLSKLGDTKSAIKGNTLNSDSISNLLIPLPPLDEQKRIVQKIEELLPLVDEYDKAEKELTVLNKRFPEQIKKSVLQYAIQGKLVPQNPHEEPAAVLLEKIKAEKIKLNKEKKIKAVTPLPAITEEEIPFEIPDNWVWVRLGEIITLISGQDLLPSQYTSNDIKGIPYITGASNIHNGEIYINRWTSTPKSIALRGDLLVSCKGTIGKIAMVEYDKVHIARQIMSIRYYLISFQYIQYVLEYHIESYKKNANSFIPGIDRHTVLSTLFPLPPLDEQFRIVEKVKEVLGFCDKLN